MIEAIQKFFKQYNLSWTGHIATIYNQEFHKATEKDFSEIGIINFLVYTSKKRYLEVFVEIDLVNFIVLSIKEKGIERDVEIENIQKNQDLSKEWFEFQLREKGMMYGVDVIKYCKKHKKEINFKYDLKTEKIVKSLDAVDRDRARDLKKYEDLEASVSECLEVL